MSIINGNEPKIVVIILIFWEGANMNKKNTLKGLEDTLYIPLMARTYASKKFPEFFYDEKACA